MAGPYDANLSDDENKALKSLENDNTVPQPDDSGEGVPPPASGAASSTAPPAAAPAAVDPSKPTTADKDADPATTVPANAAPADAEMLAFIEKNKGKTADELLELAYNQSKRASAAAFDARHDKKAVTDFAARAKAALENADRVRATAATERAAFDEQLKNDPDAATRALFEERQRQREIDADTLAHNARLDEAISFASQAIPDAATALPAALAFGREFNYSDEELGGISDGRDLVVLHLASLAGQLIKSGVMDAGGRMLQQIQPVADTPTDPRLAARPPALGTLGSTPGRTQPATSSLDEELSSYLKMSDAELAKVDPKKLDILLKAATVQ